MKVEGRYWFSKYRALKRAYVDKLRARERGAAINGRDHIHLRRINQSAGDGCKHAWPIQISVLLRQSVPRNLAGFAQSREEKLGHSPDSAITDMFPREFCSPWRIATAKKSSPIAGRGSKRPIGVLFAAP